jgi:hypothetical protein
VLKILKREKIEFPLTREHFLLICKQMNKQATLKQAVECILYSRGPDMEKSDTFIFDKFVVYLESIINKMPPFGKPRAFIDNFKSKTLLPYEISELKRKQSTLPSIRTQNPNSTDWRANIRITE